MFSKSLDLAGEKDITQGANKGEGGRLGGAHFFEFLRRGGGRKAFARKSSKKEKLGGYPDSVFFQDAG